MAEKAADALQVGSLWTFKASGRVRITRPDGSTVETLANRGSVRHVVNQPGEYSADVAGEEKPVTVKVR